MVIISRALIEWCIGEPWSSSIVSYNITSMKHNTNIHHYNNIILIIKLQIHLHARQGYLEAITRLGPGEGLGRADAKRLDG